MQSSYGPLPLPPPSLLEKLLVCATLLMVCSIFPPGYFTPGVPKGHAAESLLYQIVLAAMYGTVFIVFAIQAAKYNLSLKLSYALVLVLMVSVLSAGWSEMPSATLVRSISLVGTTLVGVYLGKRFSAKDILTMVWIVGAVCIAASLVMIIAFPNLGIVSDDYALEYERMYRGVFDNKNALSSSCVIFLIVFVYCTALFRNPWMRTINVLMILVSAWLIIISDAVTSYIVVMALVTGIIFSVVASRSSFMRFPVLVGGIWGGILLVVVLFTFYDSITLAFDRDPTLTSRTVIWKFALQYIQMRPLQGYGYGAFWETLGRPLAALHAVHAHNGYLNALLDFGLVGFLPLMFLLLSTLWRAIVDVFRAGTWLATWPLAIVLALVFSNLSEVTFLSGYSLQWCLFITVTTIYAHRPESRAQQWAQKEVRAKFFPQSNLVWSANRSGRPPQNVSFSDNAG